MLTKDNICSLFLFGSCIYALLTVFSPDSSLKTIINAGLIAYSLYAFAHCHIQYKIPKPLFYFSLLFLVSCLYGIILLVSDERLYITQYYNFYLPNDAYIKGLLINLTPLFAFYYFSASGVLDEKKIKITMFFLIAITIAEYYNNFANLFMENNDVSVNNYAYSFVLLMPFSFFISEKKWIKYSFLLFCYGFVLFGAKKGAIFTGLFCILYCIWNDLNHFSMFKRILVLLLSLLALLLFIFGFAFFMKDAWDLMLSRMEALQDGNMSHRDVLYQTFLEHFIYKSDWADQLLGHGAYATLKISDNYAHNDWLEFLIDQGLFSVLIYAVYFVSFYRYTKKIQYNKRLYAALMMIFIVLFSRTFFSMSFRDNTTPFNIMLGYLFAVKEQPCQKRINMLNM